MSELDRIRAELIYRGLSEGTPEYDAAFLAAKVGLCQERQGVSSCFACHAFDYCEIGKRFLREQREKAYELGLAQGYNDAMAQRIVGEVHGQEEEDRHDE